MIGITSSNAVAQNDVWTTESGISIEVTNFKVIDKSSYNRIIIHVAADAGDLEIEETKKIDYRHMKLADPNGLAYSYDYEECRDEFGYKNTGNPILPTFTYKNPIQENSQICFAVKKTFNEFTVHLQSHANIDSPPLATIDINKNTINGNPNPISFGIPNLEYPTVKVPAGGCLIATAAYDSEMAPQVQLLREIRDNTVLQTTSGTTFMNGFNQFYYSFSPYVADYERENPVFKEAVKVTLTPLLTSLTLLNYVEIDSEEEMLGYGIGIILLNVGMYFVAPAVLIISLKMKLQK